MIVLGIILGVLTSYFVIGAVLARIARPTIVAQNIIPKGELVYRIYEGYTHIGSWVPSPGEMDRKHARQQTTAMILGWPVYLPMFAVSTSLNKAMDKVDPLIVARQAARIAQLEEELELK